MEEVPESLKDLDTLEDQDSGQESDLEDDLDDQLIQNIREKIDAANETLPGLPSLLKELGTRLRMRYSSTFELRDLEEAIHVIQKAIRLTSLEDVAKKSDLLSDLGGAFDMKFSETDDISDLEESIRALRGCVDETSTNKLDQELRLLGLARALKTKFSKTGAMADLNEAIQVTRMLINGISEPKTRARHLELLAHLNVLKYENNGDIVFLDEAIEAWQQVVKLTPREHPLRGRRVHHLGLRMQLRYSRTGEITDLDAAIQILQESLNLTPRTDPNRAEWLHSFAVHLGHRYLRVLTLADLQEGIRALEEGIEITANFNNRNKERPGLLFHLGVQLLWRYERTQDAADLDNAIRALQDASNSSSTTRSDKYQHATSICSLSYGLFDRYKRTRALADLEEAIQVAHESIRKTERDNPRDPNQSNNLSIVMNGLALMLEERFLRLGDIADIEESIRVQRECLSAAFENDPSIAAWKLHLALELERRYQATNSMSDLTEAISLCISALHQSNSYPRTRIKAGRHAVRLCAFRSDWKEACKVAGAAMDLIPAMMLQSLEHSDKQRLIAENFELASDAAAVALNAGESPYVCLRLLEQGRSILAESLQSLRTDSLSLRSKHPEMEKKYIRLCQELDLPDSTEPEAKSLSWEARASRRYNASRELETLLVEIRKQPGFEDFLLPQTEKEMQSAANYGPIALVNVSKYRCDALLVEKHQIRSLRLPDLHSNDIEEKVQGRSLGSPPVLRWLWDTVTNPVLDALGFNCPPLSDDTTSADWPHVWWIPTGSLRRFPLHAAGRYGADERLHMSVLDRVMSSYSLSIKSMIYFRRRQQTVANFTPSTHPEEMLLVAMQDTPGQNTLPFATKEVEMLHALCKEMALTPIEPGRRKDDIVLHLPHCRIFHFAGHGHTDNADPAKSSLLLDDWEINRLTVATLMGLNLGAQEHAPPFLAYLSACGTGRTQNSKFVDESIHLISACQLAGFRHVIGTLWEVNDQTCVDVAKITYEGIRDGKMSDESVCLGLHRALRELKKRWMSTLPVVESKITKNDLGEEREAELLDGNKDICLPEAMIIEGTANEACDQKEREAKLKLGNRRIDDLAPSLSWVPYIHFG
ncbi:CHAT domain-containing protein [Xylogone sp. PMI_703]|nr:CHAT domain-containing protein [Xylogone sp. PMI_703]